MGSRCSTSSVGSAQLLSAADTCQQQLQQRQSNRSRFNFSSQNGYSSVNLNSNKQQHDWSSKLKTTNASKNNSFPSLECTPPISSKTPDTTTTTTPPPGERNTVKGFTDSADIVDVDTSSSLFVHDQPSSQGLSTNQPVPNDQHEKPYGLANIATKALIMGPQLDADDAMSCVGSVDNSGKRRVNDLFDSNYHLANRRNESVEAKCGSLSCSNYKKTNMFDIKRPQKRLDLTKRDIDFLSSQTDLSPEQVKHIYLEFYKTCKNRGKLSVDEFRSLYKQLMGFDKGDKSIEHIIEHIFRAFDHDRSGTIEFGEFLVGFAIASRGDLQARLSYAFDCYDADYSEYIEHGEIEPVLRAMMKMLGFVHVQDFRIENMVRDIMNIADVTNDGRISKTEFIQALTHDEFVRGMLNPFN